MTLGKILYEGWGHEFSLRPWQRRLTFWTRMLGILQRRSVGKPSNITLSYGVTISSAHQTSSIQCPVLDALETFLLSGHTCSMWKFLCQGLNLHHSSNLSYNARSLTCWAARELLESIFSFHDNCIISILYRKILRLKESQMPKCLQMTELGFSPVVTGSKVWCIYLCHRTNTTSASV